jgi:hypothetical protein
MPRAAALAAAFVLSAISVDACVIAEPPSDLPRLPETRPTIMHGSVVPSASGILGRWPDKFTVPVELVDPRTTIVWTAFVDYNPATGEGLEGIEQKSEFEQGATTQGRVRMLEVPIGPPSLDRCHIIEVVVALRLKQSHTPDEPGGDSVTWIYSPTGDLAGCPVLDAGIEPIPDAEAEGAPP